MCTYKLLEDMHARARDKERGKVNGSTLVKKEGEDFYITTYWGSPRVIARFSKNGDVEINIREALWCSNSLLSFYNLWIAKNIAVPKKVRVDEFKFTCDNGFTYCNSGNIIRYNTNKSGIPGARTQLRKYAPKKEVRAEILAQQKEEMKKFKAKVHLLGSGSKKEYVREIEKTPVEDRTDFQTLFLKVYKSVSIWDRDGDQEPSYWVDRAKSLMANARSEYYFENNGYDIVVVG